MYNVYLVFRSITHAQRAKNAIERHGYAALLTQPPQGMSKRGCSHAIRVSYNHLDICLDLCRRAGVKVSAAFVVSGDGSFSQVSI